MLSSEIIVANFHQRLQPKRKFILNPRGAGGTAVLYFLLDCGEQPSFPTQCSDLQTKVTKVFHRAVHSHLRQWGMCTEGLLAMFRIHCTNGGCYLLITLQNKTKQIVKKSMALFCYFIFFDHINS